MVNGKYLTLGPISRDGRAGISALCRQGPVVRIVSTAGRRLSPWALHPSSFCWAGAGHGSLQSVQPNAHFPLDIKTLSHNFLCSLKRSKPEKEIDGLLHSGKEYTIIQDPFYLNDDFRAKIAMKV